MTTRARGLPTRPSMAALLVLLLVLLLEPPAARAHAAGTSTIDVVRDGGSLHVRWAIALRDLALVVPIDTDGDDNLTWREVRSAHDDIGRYALARLLLSRDGRTCTPGPVDHGITRHRDGTQSTLAFTARCDAEDGALEIGYRLFADVDAQHRGIVRVLDGDRSTTGLLVPGDDPRRFAPARPTGGDIIDTPPAFTEFVREGIHHIGVGFDHLAFLFALLLPVAIGAATGTRPAGVRPDAVSPPDDDRGPGALRLLAVVTAFTLAHSITLALAVTGLVTPPARAVEIGIAASVVIAALNNLRPGADRRLVVMAFAFGLVHGFGFATVLDTGGQRGLGLAIALAGFNLGVEVGQAAILLAALPVLQFVARRGALRLPMVHAASLALAAFGAVWFTERLFDVHILPG